MNKQQKTTHLSPIVCSIVVRHGRTVHLVIFWWVASPELDAVGSRRSWIRHDHSEQSFVGYTMRRSVLNVLSGHYVLAVTNCDLSLTLARVVRLPHTLLVPTAATSIVAIIVPRPMRLLVGEKNKIKTLVCWFLWNSRDRVLFTMCKLDLIDRVNIHHCINWWYFYFLFQI